MGVDLGRKPCRSVFNLYYMSKIMWRLYIQGHKEKKTKQQRKGTLGGMSREHAGMNTPLYFASRRGAFCYMYDDMRRGRGLGHGYRRIDIIIQWTYVLYASQNHTFCSQFLATGGWSIASISSISFLPVITSTSDVLMQRGVRFQILWPRYRTRKMGSVM